MALSLSSPSSSSFCLHHSPQWNDDSFHISRNTLDTIIRGVVADCLNRRWNCDNDVFISFRGDDTRANITSILHGALCGRHVKAFTDEALERGVNVLPSLLGKINRSLICITVFSKDYASSPSCVIELDRILQCREVNGQIVIPIFYGVEQSNVQGLIEILGNAFIKHLLDPKADPTAVVAKAEKWKASLKEAFDLFGRVSMSIGSDRKLVGDIVEDILKKLVLISVSMAEELAKLFNMLCDKLDINAGAFWNNPDMKRLHIRLREVHHLLQEARHNTFKQHRLLRLWFKNLKSNAYDIDDLIDDFEKSEITNSRFDEAVRRIDRQLDKFLNSFQNLVTNQHNGERRAISESLLLLSPSLLPFIDSPSLFSAPTTTSDKDSYDLSSRRSAKKAVLTLEINDARAKQQAFHVVSQFIGIDDISFDPADKKMTVVGGFNVLGLASKLRDLFSAELVSLGEANEPEDGKCNKEEPKMVDKKKKKDVAEIVKGKSRKSSIFSCSCFSSK